VVFEHPDGVRLEIATASTSPVAPFSLRDSASISSRERRSITFAKSLTGSVSSGIAPCANALPATVAINTRQASNRLPKGLITVFSSRR
jgi:hypothetical protein